MDHDCRTGRRPRWREFGSSALARRFVRPGATRRRRAQNDPLPLSIGGGIGQSRTQMLFLHKAHLGEVCVSVWPRVLTDMCTRHNIHAIK